MARRPLDAERRKHYRLVSRIYALCRSGEWHLRLARMLHNGEDCVALGLTDEHGTPVKNCEGMVHEDRREICVDYRADLMATFIHECLHVLCMEDFGPDESGEEESWVREHERLIMKHLTPAQARRILLAMAAAVRAPQR